MIGALEGKIARITSASVLLMVGGVGYLVHVPSQTLNSLQLASPLFLHTYTHVREDALSLFGFKTTAELFLFELLLSVSGIGPKTALAIVDRGVSPVEQAIQASDVGFFTTIPRLGKKNAQKVIIELKSKLGSVADLDLQSDGETEELIEALGAVGFSRAEVLKVIRSIPKDVETLEQKMKAALKLLGTRS